MSHIHARTQCFLAISLCWRFANTEQVRFFYIFGRLGTFGWKSTASLVDRNNIRKGAHVKISKLNKINSVNNISNQFSMWVTLIRWTSLSHLSNFAFTRILSITKCIMNENNKLSQKVQAERICFSYGFQPIYYFSRVIGLMPYSLVYNSNGEIQEHRIYIRDGLWLATSIFVYSSVILHVFRDMKLPEDSNSTLYIFVLGNHN